MSRPTLAALSATLCMLFMPLVAGRCRANNIWIHGAGGSTQPVRRLGNETSAIREHPSIRLVSEVVRIKLPERIVHVRFVFRNEGPATVVWMGFPEEYPVGKAGESELRGFTSFVDGRRVPVRLEVQTGRSEEYRSRVLTHAWWVKRVAFARNQTRIVEEHYRGGADYKEDEGMLYNVETFSYTLRTGASWKGRIGRSLVIADIRGLRGEPLSISPAGHRIRNGRIIWDLRNFEPAERNDIRVQWADWFHNMTVNGRRISDDLAWWEQDRENDRPALRPQARDVWVNAWLLAHWLGAEATEPARNSVRLSRGGRWATVVPGSRRLVTDHGTVACPWASKVEHGRVHVALVPVVKALGGRATYDRRRKQMRVWLPPLSSPKATLPRGE